MNFKLLSTSKSLIMKIAEQTFPTFVTSWMDLILKSVLLVNNSTVVKYNEVDRKKVFSLIRQIYSEVKFYVEPSEAYQIYSAVIGSTKIKGDLAEVGVFEGGSAKVICEAKGNRLLHLFDTGIGLPALSREDQKGFFHEGEFATDLGRVRKYLRKLLT